MAETLISAGIKAVAPPPTYLDRLANNSLIQGSPSEEYWAKQAADVQFRFAAAVRSGLALNETNQQISARVRGVMELSTRQAMTLVRTAVQQVAADARRETFQRNEDVVAGIKHISTMDARTSDICIAYGSDSATGDGAEWDMNYDPINGTVLPYGEGVPRHFNCRSVEVAITKSWAELGMPELDEGYPSNASSYSSFEDWLNSQDQATQDEMLGPGRAQLWRDGKITLTQLLDQNGNAMSLAELEAKYGGTTLHELSSAARAEAVDYVVSNGVDKGHGVEFGYAAAPDGTKLFAGVGEADAYTFNADELATLQSNPGSTFVHNHSLNRSLSDADIITARAQHMGTIVAAGHDGSVYSASNFGKMNAHQLAMAYDNADSVMHYLLRRGYESGFLAPTDDAWAAVQHFDNLTVSQLGGYDYNAQMSRHMQEIVDRVFEFLKSDFHVATDEAVLQQLAQRAMPTGYQP